MKICALVGASDFNEQHFSAQQFDFIVAVDAGYSYLSRIGVIPDLVIGDFDSLSYVPDHPHVKRFPCCKDKSDIEIAFDEASVLGFDLILVYGCLGGRLDFTFAVYQLLCRFTRGAALVYAVGMDFVVCILDGDVRKSICFDKHAQGTLSLFAFTPEVHGVEEIGLEYTLDKVILRNDDPLGVSNAFQSTPSKVSIQSGTALLFFSVQAYEAIVEE